MLKKLVYIVSVLLLVGSVSASAEGLTPLQRKVREAFASIHNHYDMKAMNSVTAVEEEPVISEEPATVEKSESTTFEEGNVNVEALVAQDPAVDDIIVASDQDEEAVASDGEDDEFVVIHAPKKSNTNNELVVKTAAEASSIQRTAKINKKWSVEVLGWCNKLTGHVKIAENKNQPESGEKIDLEKDTKELDENTVPGLKASYKASNRSKVDFSWVSVKKDGKLGVDRKFKGVSYKGNADFDIDNAMFDLAWNYRLAHKVEATGREKRYVSAMVGVKISDMEFKIAGEDNLGNKVSEKYSKVIPSPYVGLEFGSYFCDDLYLKASIRYLKLNDIKNYDVKHCDYDVALSYKVNYDKLDQDIFVDVGYRQVAFDVDGEGNDVELKYKGPYIGVEWQF